MHLNGESGITSASSGGYFEPIGVTLRENEYSETLSFGLISHTMHANDENQFRPGQCTPNDWDTIRSTLGLYFGSWTASGGFNGQLIINNINNKHGRLQQYVHVYIRISFVIDNIEIKFISL